MFIYSPKLGPKTDQTWAWQIDTHHTSYPRKVWWQSVQLLRSYLIFCAAKSDHQNFLQKMSNFKGYFVACLLKPVLRLQACHSCGSLSNIWGSFEAKKIRTLFGQTYFNSTSLVERSNFHKKIKNLYSKIL